jgi:hypothetical protein
MITIADINDRRLREHLAGRMTLADLAAGMTGVEPYRVDLAAGTVTLIPEDEYRAARAIRGPRQPAAKRPCPNDSPVAARYEAARQAVAARPADDPLRGLMAATDDLLARNPGWTACQRSARLRSFLAQYDAATRPPQGTQAPPWDLVVPLGTGSADDEELRLALRAWQRHAPWLRRVWIVGRRPAWLATSDRIRHIECQDTHTTNKDANLIDKVLLVCREPDLSARFIYASDDQLPVRDIDPGDVRAYHTGEGIPAERPGRWHARQRRTYAWLAEQGRPTRHFDGHLPIPVDRDEFARVMAGVPYQETPGLLVKSTYLNLSAQEPVPQGSVKVTVEAETTPEEIATAVGRGAVFLGHNPKGWRGGARQFLFATYPTPAPWEAKAGALAAAPPPAAHDITIDVRIAYGPGKRLGETYNRIMTETPDDSGRWVLLLDHDAMLLQDDWHAVCLQAIRDNPGAGVFYCLTNRMACHWQRCESAPAGDDIAEHRAFALSWRQRNGGKVTTRDLTGDRKALSGVMILTRKAAWRDAGGFRPGFKGVDNDFFRRVSATGRWRCKRINEMYVYHGRFTNPLKGGDDLTPAGLARRSAATPAGAYGWNDGHDIPDDWHSRTAVLAVAYGNDPRRIAAARAAMGHWSEQRLRAHVVLVELLAPGETSRYADLLPEGRSTHVVLEYRDEHRALFQKEPGWNIGERAAPAECDLLIVLDNDVWSESPDWWTRIRQTASLNGSRAMIQAFHHVGHTGAERIHHISMGASLRTGHHGQPGLGYGLWREYWREIGGVNPYCISGSGDVMLYHEVAPDLVTLGATVRDCRWWPPLVRQGLPRARVGYAAVDVRHEYHGPRNERAYEASRLIIDIAGQPVRDLVHLDPDGLLAWTDPGHPLRSALADKAALAADMMAVAARVGLVKSGHPGDEITP